LWGWRIMPDMDLISEAKVEGINKMVPLVDVVERDQVVSVTEEVLGESRDES